MLIGWQAIAEYLGVSRKTAKRYKKKYGMPVHYLPSGVPCAFQDLIRAWIFEFNTKLQEKMHKSQKIKSNNINELQK